MKNQKIQNKPSYISYSAVKDWNECPHYYKLTRIDKIQPFQGNIFTAFGKAVHLAIEDSLVNSDKIIKKKGYFDIVEQFEEHFSFEVSSLPKDIVDEITQEDIHDFLSQGKEILPEVIPSINKTFPGFKVVSVEEKLDEEFADYTLDDYNFKGYIDAVLKTPDGVYHIIDWKTTSWGWNSRKKSDKITTYQLTLYKEFYHRKYDIDLNKIETHFALLKRTAKVGQKVEIFPVSSGVKKINNALKLVYNALYNIDHDNFVKKKLKCHYCPFFATVHCKHTVGEPRNV